MGAATVWTRYPLRGSPVSMVEWYRGFSVGYADAERKDAPRPPDTEFNRLWALGYMAGYLTACGIKVGQPNG